MQTLQSARLTSRPAGLPPTSSAVPTSSTAPAPPQEQKPFFSALRPIRATGILRHRLLPQPEEEDQHDADPRFTEALARFIVSNGLPYEVINDRAFREMFNLANSKQIIPCEGELAKAVERMCAPNRHMVNYQKSVGPLSVTIDVAGNDDEKYLAFSIHSYEDVMDRKNVVFLRKLLLSELDRDSLLNIIRRAVNNFSYANIKFSNMVVPNDEIYKLLNTSEVIKRYFICFYSYMTRFVADLLEIPEFSEGLNQLRTFVRFVKKHSDLYSKFRRMQLSKNADLDLPCIDDGVWENTSVFLTRCLALHETFADFADRFRLTTYITTERFIHLFHLQRILQQCVKYCRILSQPNNSVSQVVPVIMSLRNFITQCELGFAFEKPIREIFAQCFEEITNSHLHLRYDVAALLDPRYGYRDHIYSLPLWNTLESRLVEEFMNLDDSHQKSFPHDITTITKEERICILKRELQTYRHAAFLDRPEESSNPFTWWERHLREMQFLPVLAREYLASPAITIDAAYYFSNGGKFQHLCNTYGYQKLEFCLMLGGTQQEFHGRGGSEDTIPYSMVETLSATATRLQKLANQDYFDVEPGNSKGSADTPSSSTNIEEDNKDNIQKLPITTDSSSPQPPLEEKKPFQSTQPPPIPLSLQKSVANLRGLPRGLPMRLPVAQMRQAPLPVKTIPRPAARVVTIAQAAKKQSPPKPAAAEAPPAPKEEEKPKDLLLMPNAAELTEKVVKQEPIDEDEAANNTMPDLPPPLPANLKPVQVKMTRVSGAVNSPLTEKYYLASRPASRPPKHEVERKNMLLVRQAASSGLVRIPTRNVRIVPVVGQNINSHNFVQKIGQRQNFVPKYVVKPPAETRPPSMGYRVVTPACTSKLSFGEHLLPEKEIKKELEDNVNLDKDTYLEYLKNVQGVPLNDESAADALARHRANVEMQKRRACNRRCAVCNHLETHENLKNVTIDNEKLLIMLGCIYRSEFTVGHAKLFMTRESKTYICHVHFAETLDDIYKMLKVKHFGEINNCALDLIQNALLTVTVLRPHIQAVQLRKIFTDFCEKTVKTYPHLERPHNQINFERKSPEREPNDVDESDIIPKHFRQPRKQVLESDTGDMTVKVIEQEDFRLPTTGPDSDHPGACCFCARVAERGTMLRVPRSEDRLARWVEKLGPEFEARLKHDIENLICRHHFPPEAFSSRGRLLKGMIPDSAPEKVEVTYQIRGDDFLKLTEEQIGTDKRARIDLETIGGSKPKRAFASRTSQERSEDSDAPSSDCSVQDFLDDEETSTSVPAVSARKPALRKRSVPPKEDQPSTSTAPLKDIKEEEDASTPGPSSSRSTSVRRSARRGSTVTEDESIADEEPKTKKSRKSQVLTRGASGRFSKK